MAVNEYFEGYPIDFFTFQSENFAPEFDFQRDSLILDQNGYIGSDLYEKIDFEAHETAIVNCAVGQGKTSAILNTVKEFLNTPDSEEFYFVIAVPLISLITQYKRDLLELGFQEDQFFSYEEIPSEIPSPGENYININCKIHLITVNTLLGNPGEDAIMQSDEKFNYIHTFAEQLTIYNKRLIIIYDEIHEAIKNFTPEGAAQLSYFSNVIYKNILLSATFNLQSITVIKLLANFTNKKIRLLEAERKIIRPQSELFLHYHNHYSADNHRSITRLIEDLISRGKNIDILSYSKKLSKQLMSHRKPTGILLREKFGVVRDCTSTIKDNQGDNNEDLEENRYDNSACNVGTNFKSGVSIVKDDHALIIILPPKSAMQTYKTFNGVFTEGINAVIQAVARQRNKGEIHIVLPNPIQFDFSSLPDMSEVQKDQFINAYNTICISPTEIETTNNVRVYESKYYSFAQHLDIVRGYWEKQEQRWEVPRTLNPLLNFKTFDEFILEKGEKCLIRENFIARNLSSFVTYAAFTNQFYNASLVSYNFFITRNPDDDNQSILDAYLDLDSTLTVSEKYTALKDNFNISSMDRNNRRRFYQNIFKIVVENEEGEDRRINSSLSSRFIRLQCNNFQQTDGASLCGNLNRIWGLMQENIFTHGSNQYFEKYSTSPIFRTNIDQLLFIINSLKDIEPLNEEYINFFRTLSQENHILEEQFYLFMIEVFSHTDNTQIRRNGQRDYYEKIIRIY